MKGQSKIFENFSVIILVLILVAILILFTFNYMGSHNIVAPGIENPLVT